MRWVIETIKILPTWWRVHRNRRRHRKELQAALDDFHNASMTMMNILGDLTRMADEGTRLLKPFSDPSFRKMLREQIVQEHLSDIAEFRSVAARLSDQTTMN